MAILSNASIAREVKAGNLVIEPFRESSVEPASYDMGLYWKLLVSPTRYERGQEIDLREQPDHAYLIDPGRFVGILTDETLKFPLNIAARFGLRSEYTRYGLVAFGGIQIDPGYEGRLAVSLFHAGPEPVRLEYRLPTFTVEFHYLDQPATAPYQGAYQGHTDFAEAQRQFILNAHTASFGDIVTFPRDLQSLEFRFAQLESARRSAATVTAFEELARAQGVEPITSIDELRGGWPDDEDADEFLDTLKRWRSASQ